MRGGSCGPFPELDGRRLWMLRSVPPHALHSPPCPALILRSYIDRISFLKTPHRPHPLLRLPSIPLARPRVEQSVDLVPRSKLSMSSDRPFVAIIRAEEEGGTEG